MKLPADYERELLSRPDVKIGKSVALLHTPENAQEGSAKAPEARDGRRLVEASFRHPGAWIVPVYVAAGDNMTGKGFTKRRMGRARHERWPVHQVMGQYGTIEFAELSHELWYLGRTLHVHLTRLGLRKMDYSNVVAALKYIQDAVAERFGVDDGDPRWKWTYGQEISPAYGVRIEIT